MSLIVCYHVMSFVADPQYIRHFIWGANQPK